VIDDARVRKKVMYVITRVDHEQDNCWNEKDPTAALKGSTARTLGWSNKSRVARGVFAGDGSK
jgi:hypothetical protein